MTKAENMFIVAAEECAELQQAIAKALRFGLDNYHPNDPLKTSNETQILTEFAQLEAVMNMIKESGIINPLPDEKIATIQREKISAVRRYAGLSERIGRISE